ncbi:MAG: hypothetical protein O7G85_09410, partial [Planctomycetota bacterium]|nr:hypothetical protein [Planctomycetota bacterium]
MKIFWSFIALLVLVTVTLALFPGLTERLNGTELQVAKNDTARSVPMSAEVPVMSTPDDGDTSNKSQGVDADKAKEDEPELNEQAKGSLAILLDPDSSEESVDVTLPVVNPGAVDGAEDGDDALLIENEAKADPEDQGNPLKDEESTDIDSAKPVETPEAEIKTTDPAIDANAQVVSSKGEEAVAESKDEKTPP